jgi:hypothetical protein
LQYMADKTEITIPYTKTSILLPERNRWDILQISLFDIALSWIENYKIYCVSDTVFTPKTTHIIYLQHRSMRKSLTVVDICVWKIEIIWKKRFETAT